MSGQIFISYRRAESRWSARSLYDRLTAHFDRKRVFMDIDAIALGEDFVRTIEKTVGECDVLIAVIGAHWLSSTDEHDGRRLDNPEDFVRMEIGTALRRDIRVIPLLVDGALMPRSNDLPDDLKALVRRNALRVSDTGFDDDCRRLVAAIEEVFLEKNAAEQRERQRMEAERLERKRLETERLEAEQRERERERMEAERLEKERLDSEKKERLEAEARQRNEGRLKAEQRGAEQRDKNRVEAEQRETEREKVCQDGEHLAEQSPEAERLEKERQEAEAHVRAQAERLYAEQRQREEKQRLDRERLEARRREERLEKEQLEAKRKQREEQERLEAEQRDKKSREAQRRQSIVQIVESCAVGFLAGIVLSLIFFPHPKDQTALVVLSVLFSTAARFILKKIDLEAEHSQRRAKNQLDAKRREFDLKQRRRRIW